MGEITPLLVTIHNSEADNPTNQHQPASININQPRFPTSPSLSHINCISFPIILQNWCFIYHVTCPSISEQNPQLFPWEKGSTCEASCWSCLETPWQAPRRTLVAPTTWRLGWWGAEVGLDPRKSEEPIMNWSVRKEEMWETVFERLK